VDELRTKLEYDLYYIQFASIWMELLILLRTMKVALGNRG
jgi:lipopolysaccharide/colanic/teichoic acid biosynthesis glycosyltransferase